MSESIQPGEIFATQLAIAARIAEGRRRVTMKQSQKEANEQAREEAKLVKELVDIIRG